MINGITVNGLPIFVEESSYWYNDTKAGKYDDGLWGNVDQVTTRHDKGGMIGRSGQLDVDGADRLVEGFLVDLGSRAQGHVGADGRQGCHRSAVGVGGARDERNRDQIEIPVVVEIAHLGVEDVGLSHQQGRELPRAIIAQ